jgi:hypothetical protein
VDLGQNMFFDFLRIGTHGSIYPALRHWFFLKKLENHITLVVSHKWVDCSDGPPNWSPNLNPNESKLPWLDHLLYHAPPVTCSPNVMHEVIQEDNKHQLELPVAVHYQ